MQINRKNTKNTAIKEKITEFQKMFLRFICKLRKVKKERVIEHLFYLYYTTQIKICQ